MSNFAEPAPFRLSTSALGEQPSSITIDTSYHVDTYFFWHTISPNAFQAFHIAPLS
jgi:hypothetical protein